MKKFFKNSFFAKTRFYAENSNFSIFAKTRFYAENSIFSIFAKTRFYAENSIFAKTRFLRKSRFFHFSQKRDFLRN